MTNIRKYWSVVTLVLIFAAGFAMRQLTPTPVQAAGPTVGGTVSISNTTANPAITQDTSKQASQILLLVCQTYGSGTTPPPVACQNIDPQGSVAPSQFQIPPADHFVLTSLDYTVNIAPAITGRGYLFLVNLVNPASFYELNQIVDLSSSESIQFSSGIVMGSGIQPAVILDSFTTPGAGFEVFLHGYLTAN